MGIRAGYTARGSWTHLVWASDEPLRSSAWFQCMPGWTHAEQFEAVRVLIEQFDVDPAEISEGGSPEWGPSALVWMDHFAISPTTSSDAFVLDSDSSIRACGVEFPTALDAVNAYFEGALS